MIYAIVHMELDLALGHHDREATGVMARSVTYG